MNNKNNKKRNEKRVKNTKDARKITKSQLDQPSQTFNAVTLKSEWRSIEFAANMHAAALRSGCCDIELAANHACRGIEKWMLRHWVGFPSHAAALGSGCRGIGLDFLRMPRHWACYLSSPSFSSSFLFPSYFFFMAHITWKPTFRPPNTQKET